MTIHGREQAKALGKMKFLKVWAQIISDRPKTGRMYNKAYCLWEAPDIESVMEVIGKRHSSRESLSSSGFQARRSGGYNPRLVFGSLRPALAQ